MDATTTTTATDSLDELTANIAAENSEESNCLPDRQISAWDLKFKLGSLKCSDAECTKNNSPLHVGNWRNTCDPCYFCAGCGSTYFVEICCAEKGAPNEFGVYLKTSRRASANKGNFIDSCKSCGKNGDWAASVEGTAPPRVNRVSLEGNLKLHELAEVVTAHEIVGQPTMQVLRAKRIWKLLHGGNQFLSYELSAQDGVVTI